MRGLLFRPWLLAGGVCFGLAVGTKWSALYPLAAFGILVWAWSAGARRSFGVRWSVPRSALADGVPAFVHLIGVGLVVYVLTWTGWLVHAGEYEEHRSETQYTTYDGGQRWPTATEPDADGLGEVVQSLRSLWYYHQDVYVFHTHFLNDADHPYESKPSGWLLMNRPVGVDAQNDIAVGTQGCDAPPDSNCMRQVLLLGNPVIWWAGCLALLWGLVMWVGARDWRYGVAITGVASTWLPWLMYDDRPIFIFYAIADAAVPGARPDPRARPDHRQRSRAVATADGRRDRRRLLRRARDADVRVVLAGVDRPADHPQRVARPDVVPPLDLALSRALRSLNAPLCR